MVYSDTRCYTISALSSIGLFMNIKRLRAVEHAFLTRYPEGFANTELLQIAKKHQITKRHEQAQACFKPENFSVPLKVVDDMVTQISRSSLVSMFEKPRLKDWVKVMSDMEKESYALALHDMLHGNQAQGFTTMCSLLEAGKIAKWPLLTVLPYYFTPQTEVFVKPTTTKKIINFFELEGLSYRPKPSYEFYSTYKSRISEMKSKVNASLQGDNAAFTGFLMMALDMPSL